jgi:predicted nucleic acid-binding protein
MLPQSRALANATAAEVQLEGREYSVDSARVLSLAQRSGCSAYDCEFVALAEDLGARLVSNDGAVLRAFRTVAVPLRGFAPETARGLRASARAASTRRTS